MRMNSVLSRFATGFTLLLCFAPLAFAQEDTQKGKYGYKVSIRTKLKFKDQGKDQVLYSPVSVKYVNDWSASTVSIRFTEVNYILSLNNNQSLLLSMDREQCYIEREGKREFIPYQKATAGTKRMLDALFRSQLAAVTVDKEGKELSRKLSKELDEGKPFDATIENVRWFHGRFAPTKTWVETKTFDITNKGRISGPLTFTKLDKKSPEGYTLVQVTGTISKDKVATQRGTISKAKYEFKGTRAYDEKRKIWVKGETAVTFSYQLMGVDFSGTMMLDLDMDEPDPVAKKEKSKEKEAVTQAAPARHSYKLFVNTSLKFKSGGQSISVDSPHSFQYDNIVSGKTLSVQFTEVVHRLIVNGAESIRMRLTKEGTVTQQRGQTKIEPYAKLNKGSKALIDALFKAPLGSFTLDPSGKEVTRQLSNQSKAGAPFNATIPNARWFHVSFPKEKTWTEEQTFDIGQSGVITGPFKFTKLDQKNTAGQTVVQVNASLSKDDIDTDRGHLKNAKYEFKGTQVYDETKKIWVRGECKVTLSYTLHGTPIQGTMILKMEWVEGKAKIEPIQPPAKEPLPDVKIDPSLKKTYSYQLSLNTKVDLKSGGQTQMTITNPILLNYENSQTPNAVIVQLKGFQYHVLANGKTNLYVEMDKDHIGFHRGGPKQEVKADKADARNKALLTNLFSIPMAQITLNKDGKELTRKVNPKSEGAKAYDATIENLRWFHPSYPAAQSWTETRSFDVSKGAHITGPLTFTKTNKKDAGGHSVVLVKGTIKKDKVMSLRGELRNLNFVFEGQQSYDESRKVWVSGETKVTMSYQVVTARGNVDMSGTMTLKLTMTKPGK